MRFLIMSAALALAGCHHRPDPSRDARYIGLDVTVYRHTCPASIMHVEEYTDRRIGECLLLPKRYAVFNAGKVVSVLTTEQLVASIEADICPTSAAGQKCSDGIRQTLAERKNEKAAEAEEYRRLEGEAGRSVGRRDEFAELLVGGQSGGAGRVAATGGHRKSTFTSCHKQDEPLR